MFSLMRTFVLLFLVSLPLLSFAEEKIITAASVENPPYFSKMDPSFEGEEVVPPGTESRVFTGYSWDILKASYHEMGYTIRISEMPWARAMRQTRLGTLDVLFPTAWKRERQEYLHYSQGAINVSEFVVYFRQSFPIEWESLDSLNGLNIGALRGWNYGKKWDQHSQINKMMVDEILQGFSMLDAKRLDGFAVYRLNYNHLAKQQLLPNSYLKSPVFDSATEYATSGKTNLRAVQLLKVFDAGLERIKANGKFAEIEKKWKSSP